MSETYSTPRIRPSGGIELFAWYFMRISGIVLIFMALIHYAIMHVFTDIESVNYAFVVSRFANPFWRSYDMIMLLLAMIHGANGMRYLIDDYIHKPVKRIWALSILYVVTFAFLILGILAIATFQPQISIIEEEQIIQTNNQDIQESFHP